MVRDGKCLRYETGHSLHILHILVPGMIWLFGCVWFDRAFLLVQVCYTVLAESHLLTVFMAQIGRPATSPYCKWPAAGRFLLDLFGGRAQFLTLP